MSTLYIRLLSKTAADRAPHWLDLACPFAVVSHGNAIERQGSAPLSGLSDMIEKSQRVVLLLSANDVTLLHVKVPPLSAAKLKTVLPNLVEDQLLADPADCVVVAGGMVDGLRTIAVVNRAWLNTLTKTFIAFGAHQISALPAQLCLSYQPAQSIQQNTAIATVNLPHNQTDDIDITLRLSEQNGMGLTIGHEENESVASAVLRTLATLIPDAQIALHVPQSSLRDYQEAIDDTASPNGPASRMRINVAADNWSHWISGANETTLDLISGSGVKTGRNQDWRAWRWPLAIAAAVLVVNISALNFDWLHMKSEASSLRTAMVQIYKSTYPKETVIIDPLAQMQQKIAIAKHGSGTPAPDDFTALTAAFGEAWSGAGSKTAVITALEYRERCLYVRMKNSNETTAQQVRAALAKHDLSLTLGTQDLAAGRSGAAIWEIRSAR